MATPPTAVTSHQRPAPGQQVNIHGGTGFIGGQHEHHYHHDDYQAGTATQATRQATSQGLVVGAPIRAWDPGLLGVHASITVHDETTLTPYLARDHDQQLRQVLEHAAASEQPSLVLVVGTSCSGKTRTLYEAVTAVLPDWAVIAPRSDSRLAQALLDGIPARTVIWLDELQDRLTDTPSGITAAKAIAELLHAAVGPIVFAGTIWPTYFSAMRARRGPDKTAVGSGAIPELLTRATVVTVPDAFTDTDLNDIPVDDPRLRKAIDTATHASHPRRRRITQVLAGGTQLVDRLYPPEGTHPPDEFSPAARAVLCAAGDLRRIGHPNPLPRWAIEGAAPGYLTPPDHRPPDQWLPTALDEVTKAALQDDALTGIHVHDHHQHGVPALTPHWTTTPTGNALAAYDLHDYLLQDHLARCRTTPTRQALWDTVTTRVISPGTARLVAQAAERRGLLTVAAAVLRVPADDGDRPAQQGLAHVLATQARYGDQDAWTELRDRADSGDTYALQEMADVLSDRDDPGALAELRTLAAAAADGGKHAQQRLAQVLATRARHGDQDAWTELRDRANNGDPYAQSRLDEGLTRRTSLLLDRAERDDETAWTELRTLADSGQRLAKSCLAKLLAHRAGRGDGAAFSELRERAHGGDQHALDQLTHLLADRARRGDDSALIEVRRYADDGDKLAQLQLANFLADAARGGDKAALSELHTKADSGDQVVRSRLAAVLANDIRSGRHDAWAELRDRADNGDPNAQSRLADLLANHAARGNETTWTELRDRAKIAWTELRDRADNGDPYAQSRLADLLANDAARGNKTTWTELRARADNGDPNAQSRLADLLANDAARGNKATWTELRDRADNGDPYAKSRLADLLDDAARRGDQTALTRLRTYADNGEKKALDVVISCLTVRARRGDPDATDELDQRADAGDERVRRLLANILADRGDDIALVRLREMVFGGHGVKQLLRLYRTRQSGRLIKELDVNANPVYSADTERNGLRRRG